jgi:hypothetical protein
VADRSQATARRTDRDRVLESVGGPGRSTRADRATRTGPDSGLAAVGQSTPADRATRIGPDSGLASVGQGAPADRATRTGPDSGLESVGGPGRSTPAADRTPLTVRRRTAKVQPPAVESLRHRMKEPPIAPER